jgi:pilus assembly protein CpaE
MAGAKTISVTSVVGGVGVTTITANLGFALLHQSDARVALLDLDFQQGGLGMLLDVNFERTILPLARHGKLDSISLEAAMVKHSSGIYLLAAPRRIEDSEEISEQTVGAVLGLMRQLFDYVLIDCGHRVDAVSAMAWENSQEILYVLDQSVGAGRCAWRFMDVFGRLKIELEPRFVLNRYNPGHSISESQITATLQQPIWARIPRDDRLMEKGGGDGPDPVAVGAAFGIGPCLRGSGAGDHEQRGNQKRGRPASDRWPRYQGARSDRRPCLNV